MGSGLCCKGVDVGGCGCGDGGGCWGGDCVGLSVGGTSNCEWCEIGEFGGGGTGVFVFLWRCRSSAFSNWRSEGLGRGPFSFPSTSDLQHVLSMSLFHRNHPR